MKKHGYKILARNYVTPFGEADIVAKSRDGYVCFVEVKTRENDLFGAPAEAVDGAKRKRYRLIARFWCAGAGEEPPVRFDVASVTEEGVEYLEGAFF